MHIHALSLPWHIKVPLDTPTTTHQLSILLFLISIPKSPKKHHLLCLLVSSSHNAPSSEPHFSPANQSGRLSPPQLTSPGGSSPSRVTSFHTWPTPYQATASLWSTPSRRSTWTTPSWLCDPMHPRPHLKRPFACARTLHGTVSSSCSHLAWLPFPPIKGFPRLFHLLYPLALQQPSPTGSSRHPPTASASRPPCGFWMSDDKQLEV
jgi:hypothetical protein